MGIRIGSVMTGTLREQDIANMLIGEFESIQLDSDFELDKPENFDTRDRVAKMVGDLQDLFDEDGENFRDDIEGPFKCETVGETLSEAFDLLNEFAPDFVTFGTHEGDGSDFGWWASIDAVEQAVADGEARKVNAGDELPELDEGEHHYLVVNDHGNCTLLDASCNEIWSIV